MTVPKKGKTTMRTQTRQQENENYQRIQKNESVAKRKGLT